jgi:cyclopropane-fatty-acyl-phospholipid synthase
MWDARGLQRTSRRFIRCSAPRGLFLNRGIVRPQGVADGPETLFLEKNVFPGGELVHLDDVVREGERAGFEVVAMEDFRLNYALTCRAWVRNLEKRSEACRSLVGDDTYRTWLLYLAASAVSFEDGYTGAAQVLFAKR